MPETNRSLTPEMVRGYLASRDIESGGWTPRPTALRAPVTCTICGRERQDLYYLGVVGLVAGDGSITTVEPGVSGREGDGTRPTSPRAGTR